MTITDGTKAVEAALKDMRPDKNFAPKERQPLTDLLQEIKDLHAVLGDRIAQAERVLALVVGGLK